MNDLRVSNDVVTRVKDFCSRHFSTISVESLGWLSILFMHGATIPGLLALMTGLTDSPPSIDVVLMIWTGLVLLFVKAAIQKNMLHLTTIGLGFVLQAVMMMLIFFK